MCIGMPAKIVVLKDGSAIIDIEGIRREISIVLIDEKLEIGDYVLVHVGFAIAKLKEEEARENLKILKDIVDEVY
jgi:hydrogenase expression/formation protein HypC